MESGAPAQEPEISLGWQGNPSLPEFRPQIRVTDDELLRRREESLSHSERPWHVVFGCQAVSEGCRSCQAQTRLDRYRVNAGRTMDSSARGAAVEVEQALTEPASWSTPQRVVIAPLSDLFQASVSRSFIDQVLKTVAAHPQHVFLLTTRHPRRMREVLQAHPAPANLGVGVSAEDAATFAERVPYLFDLNVRWRHVVLEPLLGAVNIERIELPTRDILWPLQGIVQRYEGLDAQQQPRWLPKTEPLRSLPPLDWVIAGGERGAAPRPPHPAWLRSIRDACHRQQTPFFFRGWGDCVPTRKPDAQDPRRLLVSEAGERRAGGAIDGYTPDPNDVWFTRLVRGDEPIQFFLDGQRHLGLPRQRAPEQRLATADAALLNQELQRLAPRMKAVQPG